MSNFDKWMENETSRLRGMTKPKLFIEMNTLHEILAAAIVDMTAVLKLPNVTPNMVTWYDKEEDDEGQPCCELCLAGAVMYSRLPEPDDPDTPECIDPSDYDSPIGFRLEAINSMRRGDILDAYAFLEMAKTKPYCRQSLYFYLDHAPDHVRNMNQKWRGYIPSEVYQTKDKLQTNVLLEYMQLLQDDLKEAGI